MVKLCIFDMDGLLIDSERYMWTESMDIAAREQGQVMDDEFHKQFMGMSLDIVGQKLCERYGKDFDFDTFLKRCVEINSEIIKKGIPLMKGARELIDFLHQYRISTCIGTTTPRQGTMSLLKANKMLDDFDDIVCGDEIEHGKPAPDIYLECFNKFKVDKSEVLIFEDGNSGAHAALSSGMRLILVPDLAYLDDEVKNGAYRIIDDLSQAISIIKEENERTTSI